MKVALWMVVASVASWLAVAVAVEPAARTAALWGMIGPLVVTCGSWMLAERTYRHHPESLTSLMMAGFAGKLVFFGAYVAAMLRLLTLRPMPFVVSFTGYFIALHMTEALCLRRLFLGTRESR